MLQRSINAHWFDRRFYAADDAAAGAIDANPLSVDDIESALNADDEETLDIKDKVDKEKDKEKEDKKKEKAEKDEKDDEEEASDEEDEEEEDEDEASLRALEEELNETKNDDELEIVAPPRRQTILKEFPTFFKKFPDMERVLFREKEYTELFATPKAAREIKERADNFERFESDVLSGNLESILTASKSANENSLAKIVDNFLPTLHKVDQNSYIHLVGNVIKRTLIGAAREARETNNEELTEAIRMINGYVFGNQPLTEPKQLAKQEDTRQSEATAREERQLQERYEGVRDDLSGRTDNSLKRTIDQYIDPKGLMPDFVKRHAVNQALETTKSLIEKDGRFKAILDRLWEKAFKSNFSRSSMEAIESAFKTKAKTILPPVIMKTQREALKGLGKRASKDSKADDEKLRGPIKDKDRDASPQNKNRGRDDEKGKVPKGMSTYDYLSKD